MKMFGYLSDFWPIQYFSVYSLFLLYSVTTWVGRVTRKRNKSLALKTSPVAWHGKWTYLSREDSVTLMKIEANLNGCNGSVLLSCSSVFLKWETWFRKNPCCTLSLALAVWRCKRSHIVPCFSSNKYIEIEEDSIALASFWNMKIN